MPITKKQYRCPTCGNLEMHYTNHFGEIYCHCKKCGAAVLYCNESVAIEAFSRRQISQVTVHWYYIRLPEKYGESVDPFINYRALKKSLTDLGFKKFEVVVSYSYKVALKAHVDEKILVYDRNTFPDQYITSVGRLHNWQEFPYENVPIKEGYWLEFT
jgi:hypothetical protein